MAFGRVICPFLLLTALLGSTIASVGILVASTDFGYTHCTLASFSCPHSAPLTVLAALGYLEHLQGRACVA